MAKKPRQPESDRTPAFLSRIVDLFLRSGLSPVFIAVSLALGVLAIAITPREEEPQIVVPMADVLIQAPGLPAAEVERQIATPLEKLLFQIDGVEHVYSASRAGQAVVSLRFYVGEDREDSLVKIYNKIHSNTDLIPPDVASWVVKPIEIDDVPIVIVTLWSDRPDLIDDYGLRRIAEEVEIELQALPQTNRTMVVGGRSRVVRIELDPEALAARQTSPLDVGWALEVSNTRQPSGGFDRRDAHVTLDSGDYFGGVQALERAVVNVVDGIPVLLDNVATVADGPAERASYSWIGFGPAEQSVEGDSTGALYPAVHIAVAKKKGSNAVWVSERVKDRMVELAQSHFPDHVHAEITRDYGETANDKVNELLEALGVAILIVIGLIAYSLGWRAGLVVAAAVPIAFSLTLILNYWMGYTINRVTLFALIMSLGLVVDDPIVDVENIHRHLRMRLQPPLDAVRTAVNEVRPPILLATLAVIVSFLPMMLITGMMGPYMQPMAFNVPVAMLMSLVVAFTITPWMAYRMMRHQAVQSEERAAEPVQQTGLYRSYVAILGPVLSRRDYAWWLLAFIAALFLAAMALAAMRAVPLKMLPFDNKNELQILVDPPEGTTLERTDAIVRKLSDVLQRTPEVRNFQAFVGLASPMDFNGMVRHYYLRRGPHVADIRVNLADKQARAMQSHEIALRIRGALGAVADREGARIAVIEVPPGPPVLATITAEIYGEPGIQYDQVRAAARVLGARLEAEPGVVDVDSTVEDDAERIVFVTDQEKAALSGIASYDIGQTTRLAFVGRDVARLHVRGEVNPLPIRLRLPRATRSSLEALRSLMVKGRPGIAKIREGGGIRAAPIPIVRLGELGTFETRASEKAIYHKDLNPVAFVYAEAAGREPVAIIADVAADLGADPAGNDARPLGGRTYFANGGGISWNLPQGTRVAWLGEGELNITRDVFRDLGIAFAVALLGIYMILVYQTKSYAMPLILMISIPLTMIGIMPGFWILNQVSGASIGGFANPTFFTATAMIGMIALSGIAVRNAILLIEYVHAGLARGLALQEAILEAGAVRTKAILLTAGTAMLAAVPITLDPVFSGLAWALIFGLFVSTTFTLIVVPVTYNLFYLRTPGHGLPARFEQQVAS